MIREAVLSISLVISACTPTFYTETTNEIRLNFGGGGLLKSKLVIYEKFYASDKRVIIDGQMVSADAFYAFGIPGVCYTENAIFSPHAASYLGLWPARRATEFLTYYLPEPLREWFRGNIAYYDWIGFAQVGYEQLLRIWPEGACHQEDARAAMQPDAIPSTPTRQLSMNVWQSDWEELRTPNLR